MVNSWVSPGFGVTKVTPKKKFFFWVFRESGVKIDFQNSRNLCRISKEMILFFVKFEEREQYENYKDV